ncbi:CHAT domain-containing protein [Emticicia sp. BO119]|uniref:CHAT domain-containing protein n=1 Tax=Emticicia sp. BO119 TaxID=2757768 RepID=UPI0015F08C43|nr:CHAT domain-containing tetratricopeptide repeat protein [Emticicia sp. BO119]MBA4853843.1 CHAT domain-containing protein [Emticicia sp. BO119]
MNKRLLTFIGFIISGQLFAQCPTDLSVAESIKKFAILPPDQTITQLEKLYKTTLTCKNIQDSTRGNLCNNLTYYSYIKNKADKALLYSKLSLKYWETYVKQKPLGLTYAAYGAAAYHHLLLSYSEAIRYYRLTIQYTNDPYWKGYSLKLISDLELELGDYEGMLNTLNKAESFAENNSQSHLLQLMSQIYNSKGIAYSRLENEKKAIESLQIAQNFYQKSFQISKTDEGELKGNIHANMGISYYNLKDFQKSEKNFKKAEQIFIQYKFNHLIPMRIHNNMGLLYTAFHHYKEADLIFDKAINALKNKKSVELSRVYLNYATNLREENKIDSAISNLEKAIEAFPLLDIKKQNFSIIRSKRTLFYILRDYGKSLLIAYQKTNKPELLSRSVQYFSYADLLLNLMRQEHQGGQSRSFWREHSRSLYESAIEACLLAENTQKGFYFFEKSRAILLLDNLKEHNARQLLSASEQQKEKKYQEQIFELQTQLEKKPENSAEYKEIVRNLSAVNEAFNDFKKDLEKRFPAYYAAKYNEDFKDLATFQQWLRTNQHQAFITYFVGDSATYALKVSPEITRFIKIAGNQQNLTTQFLNFCSNIDSLNKNFTAFLSLSNQLYNNLIKPLEVPEGRISISYDDHFLPFEALSLSAQKNNFLVEHYAISYAYSANFLLKSIEKKNQPAAWFNNISFLGVAPVHFAKSLSVDDLPLSAGSILAIEKTFNGSLLMKNEANKQLFMQQFPDYQLVQLYTHADTTQKGPVFYLQDAPVFLSEINPVQAVKTEMIVLSACKTGLGKNIKGEGIFSLSRGFSAIGIPSLITTLWSVDEKSTYTITELFYKNLKAGMPKDIALQKAKQTFIQADNRNILPVLWASSILIGDTSPVEQSDWWFIGLLIIILSGGGLFLYLRQQKQKP